MSVKIRARHIISASRAYKLAASGFQTSRAAGAILRREFCSRRVWGFFNTRSQHSVSLCIRLRRYITLPQTSVYSTSGRLGKADGEKDQSFGGCSCRALSSAARTKATAWARQASYNCNSEVRPYEAQQFLISGPGWFSLGTVSGTQSTRRPLRERISSEAPCFCRRHPGANKDGAAERFR